MAKKKAATPAKKTDPTEDTARKTPARKAVKKAARKASSAKKAAAPGTPAKPAAKKSAPKKAAVKKAAAEKSAAKKTTVKKAAAKRSTARKSVARKPARSGEPEAATAVAETTSGSLTPSTRRPSNPAPINGLAWNRPDRVAKRALPSHGVPDASGDLPDRYGRTSLTVLVRDAEWIYVYWEIAPATSSKFGADWNGATQLVLRLIDIRNDEVIESVRVGTSATSWYMSVPRRGQRFAVELGIAASGGSFSSIMRSNEFEMPRAEISNEIDWALNESNEEEHLEIIRMSGGAALPSRMSSADLVSQLRGRLLEDSGLSSGSLARELSSGFARTQPAAERGFWLVVDTEVIVYGATEPDARVRLMGREINLNPDGTFGVRVALPNGRIDFPVSATSEDGQEVIEVCPVVTRETRR